MSSESTTDGSLFCYENLPPEKPIDEIPPGTTRYICERGSGKIKPLRRARLRPLFLRCKCGAKLTKYISSDEETEVNPDPAQKNPKKPVEIIDLEKESEGEGSGKGKAAVTESRNKGKGRASGSGGSKAVAGGQSLSEKQQKKGSLSGMKRVRSGLPVDPEQLADEDYMDFLRDVHPKWFSGN